MSHETETGSWDEYEEIPAVRDFRRRNISATAHAPQSLSVDQSDKRDQSVNKTMPWIAVLAIISTAALCISGMGFIVLWDKYQLVERECRLAQYDITELKRGK